MKALIGLMLLLCGAGQCGMKYIGASQTNIEGGYSSDPLNLGIGIRAFLYNVSSPSRLASNGDLDVTAFYLQKKIGQAKLQFGSSYEASYVYSNRFSGRPSGFDIGSAFGIVKTGIEGAVSESIGVYGTCVPIHLGSFNLFRLGERDFNDLDIGVLDPKVGIRLYF